MEGRRSPETLKIKIYLRLLSYYKTWIKLIIVYSFIWYVNVIENAILNSKCTHKFIIEKSNIIKYS